MVESREEWVERTTVVGRVWVQERGSLRFTRMKSEVHWPIGSEKQADLALRSDGRPAESALPTKVE
jgi:hypothetical protein